MLFHHSSLWLTFTIIHERSNWIAENLPRPNHIQHVLMDNFQQLGFVIN